MCPVKIPLPKLMRHWREREFAEKLNPPIYRAGLSLWSLMARRPALYHALIELETVRLLAGKQEPTALTATLAAAAGNANGAGDARLPAGERPDLELRWAFGDAHSAHK